jgi:DNA (cytosine-5)-methyltransferase 1
VPIFEDIFDLTGEEVMSHGVHERAIDVVHGGFPCQPFSVAGKRKSKSDERYLWPEFSRLVAEVKPRWVIAENVPGIMRLAADDVCSDLEGLGYAVGVWLYEAASVGAPHRRMRVFFVAHSVRAGEDKTRTQNRTAGAPERSGAGAVEDAGCGGCSVTGTFCRERGGMAIADVKRSGRAFLSNAPCRGRRQGPEITRGRSERTEPGAWAGPASSRSDFSNSDGKGESQQDRSFDALGERSCDICGIVSDPDLQRCKEQQSAVAEEGERAPLRPTERGSRRQSEPGVGGMAPGPPAWLDGYWRIEPDIPRTARGVKDRVKRLKALGNCVVPAQAYPLFRAIAEIETEERYES